MSKRASRILWSVFFILLIVYLFFTPARRGSGNNRIKANVDPIGSVDSLSEDLKRVFEPGDDFRSVPEPGPGDWLAQHEEPGQTYDQYTTSFPNRPNTTRSKIYLQPLGLFSDESRELFNLLPGFVQAYFQIETIVTVPLPLAEINIRMRIHPVTGCRQLNVLDILAQLKPRVPDDAFCVLALTQEDLYPRDSWNYVFGYASFRERVGVYSFARYDPVFFGQPRPDHFEQLFLRRSLQIVAHEITHMYSLKHCIYYHCVANGSNNLQESDAQPLHLCPVCLRKLHFNIGFNVVQRYRDLHEFYQKAGVKKEADWIKDRLEWITGSDDTNMNIPIGNGIR